MIFMFPYTAVSVSIGLFPKDGGNGSAQRKLRENDSDQLSDEDDDDEEDEEDDEDDDSDDDVEIEYDDDEEKEGEDDDGEEDDDEEDVEANLRSSRRSPSLGISDRLGPPVPKKGIRRPGVADFLKSGKVLQSI